MPSEKVLGSLGQICQILAPLAPRRTGSPDWQSDPIPQHISTAQGPYPFLRVQAVVYMHVSGLGVAVERFQRKNGGVYELRAVLKD